ncbi:MAG: hypothetical protein ACOH2R_22005 [Pseudomonas sp.]
MFKRLSLFCIAGLMVGCASAPEADEAQPALHVDHPSCYQAGWQEETVPVIDKRGGQEALDKYESAPKGPQTGCR